MFYKEIILSLFLSAIYGVSAMEVSQPPVSIPQERQQSCRRCWEIVNSSQVITNSFYRKDKTQYFIQIQSQLGESFALRNLCSCGLRNRIVNYLKEKLSETWSQVTPAIIQELRDKEELYYDVSQLPATIQELQDGQMFVFLKRIDERLYDAELASNR
jgi:hypothetical protein